MLRIPYPELESSLAQALLPLGFTPPRARLCARLFAETTRDGVYTHGLARVPRFVATIRNGTVLPEAEPTLISDPAAIEQSQRALPVGFWKGSGLSLSLDLIAAMLAGGSATYQIPLEPEREAALSQVFLAIDPSRIADPASLAAIAEGVLADLKQAPTISGHPPRYPGEQTLALRQQNLTEGIPVDPEIWKKLLNGSL